MRIVSLLPSSTEILFALGLGDQVVAVSHDCDHPPEAKEKPALSQSALGGVNPGRSTSREIDEAISKQLHKGQSIYHLDQDLLRRLEPDLILTQELCVVCAPSFSQVRKAARVLKDEVQLISLEPNRLGDIFENIRLVGEVTQRKEEAERFIEKLKSRIHQVVSLTRGVNQRPRVFCMEWLDPPMVAGHWVPEMVRLAGGEDGLGREGDASYKIEWEEIFRYDPEVVLFMPCSFGLERTLEELKRFPFPKGWKEINANKEGQCFAVDGASYFNRPGPRIIDGLEILAQILHPVRLRQFQGDIPEGAMQRWDY